MKEVKVLKTFNAFINGGTQQLLKGEVLELNVDVANKYELLNYVTILNKNKKIKKGGKK